VTLAGIHLTDIFYLRGMFNAILTLVLQHIDVCISVYKTLIYDAVLDDMRITISVLNCVAGLKSRG
jgi:hypothetical protein